MMHIKIVAVGNIKEKYFRDAIAEYVKRLKPYCKLLITEVDEDRAAEKPSDKDRARTIKREGESLLAKVSDNELLIALDVVGNFISSEGLADKFEKFNVAGKSKVCFVIGGAFGIAPEVLKKADFVMSISKMTFTHQMARMILIEQIYRIMKINAGEPYHN